MGAGALGQAVDDFNSDLFDHGPHGFIGGGYIALWTTGGRPILQHHVPKDTPKWGSRFKRALAENYLKSASIATHGSVMSYRDAYLDLDPTWRDTYGNPMLRLTFDYHDNEHRMSGFLTDRATDVAKAMKTRAIHAKKREGHYSIVPYQTTHNTGVVGRNYAYQITSAVDVFLDEIMNPFMGAGALGQAIDEFNGDNFDHGPQGFVGGGYIALWTTGGRPILQHQLPEGTPKWGAGWKKAMAENYLRSASIATHGSVMSYRDAYLDLDPTYHDIYGDPLLRLTFDFHPNEIRMSQFLTDKAALIAQAMHPRSFHARPRTGHYSIIPYQTTHNTGGCAMGADPKTSVVNKYLQSWDVPNVFVLGASVFPQNHGYNPTGTVGALAFWAADAIVNRYLKAPGPLVEA
jgi:choline dehydrogenase-like flavoprotein